MAEINKITILTLHGGYSPYYIIQEELESKKSICKYNSFLSSSTTLIMIRHPFQRR